MRFDEAYAKLVELHSDSPFQEPYMTEDGPVRVNELTEPCLQCMDREVVQSGELLVFMDSNGKPLCITWNGYGDGPDVCHVLTEVPEKSYASSWDLINWWIKETPMYVSNLVRKRCR